MTVAQMTWKPANSRFVNAQMLEKFRPAQLVSSGKKNVG